MMLEIRPLRHAVFRQLGLHFGELAFAFGQLGVDEHLVDGDAELGDDMGGVEEIEGVLELPDFSSRPAPPARRHSCTRPHRVDVFADRRVEFTAERFPSSIAAYSSSVCARTAACAEV
ncbi:MAG: hypothetical protein ACLUFV_12645 [Acutalibacteraceae bacterium]